MGLLKAGLVLQCNEKLRVWFLLFRLGLFLLLQRDNRSSDPQLTFSLLLEDTCRLFALTLTFSSFPLVSIYAVHVLHLILCGYLHFNASMARRCWTRPTSHLSQRSSMIGNSRVKKMTSRDGLLQELLATATSQITRVSKGSQYPTLLKALIVQSMIKIEEDKITVICREADIGAVKSVVNVRQRSSLFPCSFHSVMGIWGKGAFLSYSAEWRNILPPGHWWSWDYYCWVADRYFCRENSKHKIEVWDRFFTARADSYLVKNEFD